MSGRERMGPGRFGELHKHQGGELSLIALMLYKKLEYCRKFR